MPDPKLSAEQLAAILDGTAPELADHPVAEFVARSREALAGESGPPPSEELATLMAGRAVTDPAPPPEPAAEVIDLTAAPDPHPRRIPVFAALTSLLGTLGGKLAVSTAAAAAVAGGAHAAGVVDVPLLPDDSSIVETDDVDPDDDTDVDSGETNEPSNIDLDDGAVEDNDDDTDEANEPSTIDMDDGAVEPDDDTDEANEPSNIDMDDDHESDDDSDPVEPDDHDDDSDSGESDDHDDDSTATSTSSTVPAGIPDQTLAYTVEGVGTTTVQVRGGVLSLVSAVPATGWSLDEAGMDGAEAESEYVRGSIEVDIDVQIDDGLLRVRVRERDDATDTRSEFFEYFDADGNSLGSLGRS